VYPGRDYSSISRQLPESSAGDLGLAAFFFQAPFGIALKRTKHSPAREHHRTAIFGGVDQHVNGKSPFLSMAL
jgi:hypothetical protein